MIWARRIAACRPFLLATMILCPASPTLAADTVSSGAVSPLIIPHPNLVAAAPVDPAACPPGHDAYALVTVNGLKDRRGTLRVELYPDTQKDFVVNILGRVEIPTPPGEPTICIALPKPGRYAIVVHHDRNTNNKFDLFIDGFGFSNNPKLGFSLPGIDKVAFNAGPGMTMLTVDLRYFWSGGAPRHKSARDILHK